MAIGLFNALFNIAGNAPDKLQQMQAGARALTSATSGTSAALKTLQSTLMQNTTASDFTRTNIAVISKELGRLQKTGLVTSSALVNLSKQMLVSAQTASPILATRLRQVSDNLITMSANIRVAERAAARAGAGGFNMMRDVSEKTQEGMQMLSAASQGLMISMSLLQRNITGLAFSLIFLQFSGFLKLSLAIAGVVGITGGLIMGFRSLARVGRDLTKLGDKVHILTGNAQGLRLVIDAAEKSSRKWGSGLRGDLIVAFAELLTQVQASEQDLDTFTQALILLEKDALPGNIDSLEGLIDAFIKYKKEGEDVEGLFAGLAEGVGKYSDQLRIAEHQRLNPDEMRIRETADEFDKLRDTAGKFVGSWWQEVSNNLKLLVVGFWDVIQGDFSEGFSKMWDALPGAQEIWEGVYTNLIKPFLAIWNVAWEGLMSALDWLTEFDVKITEGLLGLSEQVTEWVTGVIDTVTGFLDDMVQKFTDWKDKTFLPLLNNIFSTAFEIIETYFTGIFKRVKEIVSKGWEELKELFWTPIFGEGGILSKVSDFALGIVSTFDDIDWIALGERIVEGIWSGIESLGDWIRRRVTAWASSLLGSVTSGLGPLARFLSPASQFGVDIGRGLGLGFMRGLDQTMPAVSRAIKEMQQDVTAPVVVQRGITPMGAGIGGRAASIRIDIHGNTFSGDPRRDGQLLASTILKGITRSGNMTTAPLVP